MKQVSFLIKQAVMVLFAIQLLIFPKICFSSESTLPYWEEATTVFDYVESQLPDYFNPSGMETRILGPYAARYYTGSDTWIATDGETLLVYGTLFDEIPPLGLNIKTVGYLREYLILANETTSLSEEEAFVEGLENAAAMESTLLDLLNSDVVWEDAVDALILSLENREDMIGGAMDESTGNLILFFKTGLKYMISPPESLILEEDAERAVGQNGTEIHLSREQERYIQQLTFYRDGTDGSLDISGYAPGTLTDIPGVEIPSLPEIPEVDFSDLYNLDVTLLGLPHKLPGNNRALLVKGNSTCYGDNDDVTPAIKSMLEEIGYQVDVLDADMEVFSKLPDYSVVFLDVLGGFATGIGNDKLIEFAKKDFDLNALYEAYGVNSSTELEQHPSAYYGLFDAYGPFFQTTTPATKKNILKYREDIRMNRIYIRNAVRLENNTQMFSLCPPMLAVSNPYLGKITHGKTFQEGAVFVFNFRNVWLNFPSSPSPYSPWLKYLKDRGNFRLYGWMHESMGEKTPDPDPKAKERAITNFFSLATGADYLLEGFDNTPKLMAPSLPNMGFNQVHGIMIHNAYNLDLVTGSFFCGPGLYLSIMPDEDLSLAPIINNLGVDRKGMAYLVSLSSISPYDNAQLFFMDAPDGEQDYYLLGPYSEKLILGEAGFTIGGNWKFKLPYNVTGRFQLLLEDGRKSRPATLFTWKPSFTISKKGSYGETITASVHLLFRSMVNRNALGSFGMTDILQDMLGHPHSHFIYAKAEEEGSSVTWDVSGSNGALQTGNDGDTVIVAEGGGRFTPEFDIYSNSFWHNSVFTLLDGLADSDMNLSDDSNELSDASLTLSFDQNPLTYTVAIKDAGSGELLSMEKVESYLDALDIQMELDYAMRMLGGNHGTEDQILDTSWLTSSPMPEFNEEFTRH